MSGFSVQVSGRGGAKYCWDVVLLLLVLVLVLVLVLGPLGKGFQQLSFSITRTSTTTRTRNNLPGILGICHLCLCSQTASTKPFLPPSLGRNIVPIYEDHIMFAHDLCHSQIEYFRNAIDLN